MLGPAVPLSATLLLFLLSATWRYLHSSLYPCSRAEDQKPSRTGLPGLPGLPAAPQHGHSITGFGARSLTCHLQARSSSEGHGSHFQLQDPVWKTGIFMTVSSSPGWCEGKRCYYLQSACLKLGLIHSNCSINIRCSYLLALKAWVSNFCLETLIFHSDLPNYFMI